MRSNIVYSLHRPPAPRADVSTNANHEPSNATDKDSFYDIVDKDMDGNEGAPQRVSSLPPLRPY